MNIRVVALASAALLSTALAIAAAPALRAILPDALQWTSPPNLAGVRGAWVLGGDKLPGTYVQRVQLAAGARIPAHTHPDERYSTVLSGTLYVGFGSPTDDAAMQAIPAGGVYVAPANVTHSLWARDGEVVYQEAGTGPTGTTMAPR